MLYLALIRMSEKLPETLRIQVEQGISVLKLGGLIAYPTDTVYGLGAPVFSPEAVLRVFQVKKRPQNMALPLLLSDISQLDEVAASVPPLGRFLAKHFWPGALTIILQKSNIISDIITAGSDSVGVRIPNHPVPLALVRGLGAPITGTSANLSGKPSPLTAEEVQAQIGAGVNFIIDGGRTPGGIESTVVDVTLEKPVILRQGAISRDELARKCAENGFKVEFSIK